MTPASRIAGSAGRGNRLLGLARRRPHLTATLALAVVLAVWFFPLLRGEQMGQSNVLWRSYPWLGARPPGLTIDGRSTDADIAYLFHPLLTVAREQVRAGEVPVWNPYSYGGTALLGDLETAIFFPLTWPAFVLGVNAAWGWIVLLKLFVAGFGAYALGRRLKLPWAAALLGGLVYMLSAPMVGWAQWSLASVAALFPWLLLATDRLRSSPDRRRMAQLALVVGLLIVAGHPETAWMAGSAAAAYLLVLVAVERLRRASGTSGRDLARLGRTWLGAQVLGVCVSAVALVPFLQAYAVSVTREEHASYFAHSRLPRIGVLTYLLPGVFGDYRRYYELSSDWNQTAAYVGIAALLLAGVAGVRERRNSRVLALAAMMILALLAAFGLPPVSWLFGVLPPFDGIITFKVLWVPALVLALGCGAGFASLVRSPLRIRHALWAAGGVAVVAGLLFAVGLVGNDLPAPGAVEARAALRFAVALALATGALCLVGRVPRGWATAAVVVVVLADLAYLRGANAILPPDSAHPGTTPALRALSRAADGGHVSSDYAFFFRPAVLPPNTAALAGLRSVTGYDFPLSRRWADLSTKVWGQTGNTPEHSYTSPRTSGASLLALRMMNTTAYLAAPETRTLNPGFVTVYRGRDGVVQRDPRALPRAYVVPRTRPLDDDETLRVMRAGSWNPRVEALVPGGSRSPAAGAASRREAPLRPARVTEIGSQRLEIGVPPGPGGWLVLSQGFAPEWDAKVDGREVALRPTNLAATGLPLGPGAHRVEIAYDLTGFRIGLGVTAASLLLCALLLARRPRALGRRG